MDGRKTKRQGEMAVLEYGADPQGKGRAAGVELPQANRGRFALKPPNLARIGVLTMRTIGSVGPKLRLYVGKSGFLIVETGVGKNRLGHGLSPWPIQNQIPLGMSSETSPINIQ